MPTSKTSEEGSEIHTTSSCGIKVEEARTITGILPVDKGGTGFNFLGNKTNGEPLDVPQDALIVFNRSKNCFGYIRNEPGTIYYDDNYSFNKGILPLKFGGTGATTAKDARANLGLGTVATENIVPVSKGGTGATTAAKAAIAIVGGQSITPANISTTGSQYWTDGKYGLHLNNSCIVGINGLWFPDAVDSAGEGINFYRGSDTWDRLYAYGGTLYFAPNIATKTHPGTRYSVFHSGSTIPVKNGGTGATDAEGARENLGVNLKNLGISVSATEINYLKGLKENIVDAIAHCSKMQTEEIALKNYSSKTYTFDGGVPFIVIVTIKGSKLSTEDDTPISDRWIDTGKKNMYGNVDNMQDNWPTTVTFGANSITIKREGNMELTYNITIFYLPIKDQG